MIGAALTLIAIACDRDPSDAPSPTAGTFVDVTSQAGLDFVHTSGATGSWEMPEIMGGGAAFFDANGDGYLDIYLTSGGVNRYYQQQPDGTFADTTAASGLGDAGYDES